MNWPVYLCTYQVLKKQTFKNHSKSTFEYSRNRYVAVGIHKENQCKTKFVQSFAYNPAGILNLRFWWRGSKMFSSFQLHWNYFYNLKMFCLCKQIFNKLDQVCIYERGSFWICQNSQKFRWKIQLIQQLLLSVQSVSVTCSSTAL